MKRGEGRSWMKLTFTQSVGEAHCLTLGECLSGGTLTFLILGRYYTGLRVALGLNFPLDTPFFTENIHLAPHLLIFSW